jgi:hypothetical protein
MSLFDRVSTINSARSISDVKTLLSRCNISCIKCLDTKKLWTERSDSESKRDGRGRYELISCNECADGRRIRLYASKPDKDENGVAIFNKLNRDLKSRVEELNKLLTDKDIMKREWEKMERQARKKINEEDGATPEDIDIDINDPEPKWYRNDEVECEYAKDKPIDEIVEDLLSHEKLKIDEQINLKEILLAKLKKPMQTVRKDHELFILIKVAYRKPSRGLKGLFCCCTGMMDDIRSVKVRIMKPKNVVAFDECHSYEQNFHRQISMLAPIEEDEENEDEEVKEDAKEDAKEDVKEDVKEDAKEDVKEK